MYCLGAKKKFNFSNIHFYLIYYIYKYNIFIYIYGKTKFYNCLLALNVNAVPVVHKDGKKKKIQLKIIKILFTSFMAKEMCFWKPWQSPPDPRVLQNTI